jgi:sugar lactone lactonase YvrE
MNNEKSRNIPAKAVFCVLFAGCVLATVVTANAATPKVTTVAGGYVGDGKAATSASFEGVAGVVQDTKGNLYVSDSGNCRIRKISAKGIITTVAGTGICGYSGDGGPAKSAELNDPMGLAFDAKGNLLFAEYSGSRIRKITIAGTISTVAGNGKSGYSGDGGRATRAMLAYPEGVSADALSNVYIADTVNCVIRQVTAAGVIHTVAGNHACGFSGDGGPATSAQLNSARSVLADGNGNFYISDNSNGRVRKVDSTGTITTYAGNGQTGNGGNGGPATSASIGTVLGLWLGGGKLYVSTVGNVWAVDLASQIINLVAGTANGDVGFSGDGQPALSTSFYGPTGIALDAAGNLLIADYSNDRLRKVDSSQVVTTIAGGYIGDGRPAVSASLNSAFGRPAFDSSGNLYIADSYNNRVRKVSPTGIISTFAGTGITGYSGDGGLASSATLNLPMGVAVDGNGNVFISDFANGVIRKVDNTGTISTFSSGEYANGLAVDPQGNVYVAGDFYDVIWRITPTGSASIVAGVEYQYGYNGDGIPATQAWLGYPTGVALDSAGNLYIADWLNFRVRKVDTNGIISTVTGNGVCGYSGDGGPANAAMVCGPEDVAVDAKGNLYVADAFNDRVRVVDGAGIINTLAGTGNSGYNGNGLPAALTDMYPTGITVSPKGIVYVTDEASYRVRKIH